MSFNLLPLVKLVVDIALIKISPSWEAFARVVTFVITTLGITLNGFLKVTTWEFVLLVVYAPCSHHLSEYPL